MKVKVFGAGSLEVEWTDAKDVLSIIDRHLAIEKAMDVKRIRKGPKPKAQKPPDEVAEGNNHD